MTKDRRYSIAKKLILSGDLKTLQDLVEVVPKTVIAKDLGTHLQTFSKMLSQPDLFTFRIAYRIAALLEADEKAVIEIIHAEHLQQKKTGKRK